MGEELKPIVAGPLDAIDCAVFMITAQHQVTFSLKWDRLRDYPDHSFFDAESNMPRWASKIHLNDAAAQARWGTAAAIGLATQSERLLCHLITNWMGDDGFLKVFEAQSRRINSHSDTRWMKGRVTKKYVDNDEHLVDLDVHCENQDGVTHMTGTATVRLPSRTRFFEVLLMS